jgi:hypothetical protein
MIGLTMVQSVNLRTTRQLVRKGGGKEGREGSKIQARKVRRVGTKDIFNNRYIQQRIY